MNNYYPYNGWYVSQMPQQVPESFYRDTPDRRFELNVDEATKQDLGHGFIRYLWAPTQVRMKPNEIVDLIEWKSKSTGY